MEDLIPTLFHEIYRKCFGVSYDVTQESNWHWLTNQHIHDFYVPAYTRDNPPGMCIILCQGLWPKMFLWMIEEYAFILSHLCINDCNGLLVLGHELLLLVHSRCCRKRGGLGIMPHRPNTPGLTAHLHTRNLGVCGPCNRHHPARTPGIGCIRQYDGVRESTTTFWVQELWSSGQGIPGTTNALSSMYIHLIWHGGNNSKVKICSHSATKIHKAWTLLLNARFERKSLLGHIPHLKTHTRTPQEVIKWLEKWYKH